MHYDLVPFYELVKEGMLRRDETDELIIFGYTDACTFARNWNEQTRQARGIIFEKETGKLIAKPFSKFFNLNEMEETRLTNLPNEPYVVTEKMDGSLGIIFNYAGKWQVATRGSFKSEQAIKATEMLSKYDLSSVPEHVTLLVEIIYGLNKIVVNYGDKEELVLLGAFDRDDAIEYPRAVVANLADRTRMPLVTEYAYTIEQMIDLQKILNKDNEGFVVRYNSGLRIKIKCDEYMRIHKMIANMSPLSFWEGMKSGVVDTTYLAELPEEYRPEYEPMVKSLEEQYSKVYSEVLSEYETLPRIEGDPNPRKTIGLHLKVSKLKHQGAMFAILDGESDRVNKYVMTYIRPIGNVLREL